MDFWKSEDSFSSGAEKTFLQKLRVFKNNVLYILTLL